MGSNVLIQGKLSTDRTQVKEISVDSNGRILTTSTSVSGSDGVSIPLDSLQQTLSYNADNTLNTITVSYNGATYVQTFSYSGGNVTGISQWVKQ